MSPETYASSLGGVIMNLHSLEFVLRAFLLAYNKGKEPFVELRTLQEGQWVETNSFTNYDTLNDLICKYNAIISEIDASLCVQPQSIIIRDTLAHGRVASDTPTGEMQILKFSKPRKKDDKVKVEVCEALNPQWFKSSAGLVRTEVKKVARAVAKLGY